MTDSAHPSGPAESNPKHLIRGERVYLRPPERAELPLLLAWINDAETASFITNRAPISLAAEEQWFDKLLADHGKTRWFFVICVIESGQPIGTTSFFDVDHVLGSAGFGIVIGEKSLWGSGYGTDTLNAMLDFAFGSLRLERVWLEVNDDNVRAQRSYAKAGFTLEGTERHAFYRRGKHLNLLLMSILRDEWAALPRKRSWEY